MKTNRRLVGASVAAAAAVLHAAADTGADAPADTISRVLEHVEIVANRATAKTPVAYTNVGKRELLKSNDGRDMTYLLQSTPSVTVTSDAGAGMGYTSMRVRGTDGSRINVTANGIPINNPESHNVYWVNMPDLASSLRDVQIQRGAGTSTNGAGAFGASVNMLTDAPSEDPYGELSGAYGSYNTNRVTFRAGSGVLREYWSVDARLSHMSSDGYIDRASSELWSYFGQVAYHHYNTNVRLLAFGGKEQTYMAWDYASKEDMAIYGRRYNPCGQYIDDKGQIAYYPDQKDNYAQHHFQLLVSQRINSMWRLNVAAHFTKDNGYYDQYKQNRTLQEYGLEPFVNADGEKIKKSDLIRLKNNVNSFGGAQFSANYSLGAWEAVAGLAYTDFAGHHFGQVKWVRNYVGPLDPLQRYYDNHGHKKDLNMYVRTNYDFSREMSAFADLQLRHIRYSIDGQSDNWDWNTEAPAVLDVNRRWTFFNPKIGINYAYGNHRAFASWAVAQKEPVRDCFTDGDPAHRPESERLNDFELGYSLTAGRFTGSVNLYYMLYHDQLVATGELSDTGNPLSINVPKSYRAGIELQGNYAPVYWFEWQVNATLSRNRILDFVEYIYEDGWTNPITVDLGDTPIAFSPSVLVNNSFNFRTGGFEGSLQTRYVSRQYMTNAGNSEAKLDAYCVSDLHLAYTFTGLAHMRSLRVGVSVYNIFDERYFSNGYAGAGYTVGADGQKNIYRYAGYAAQAPIHAMATVTLRF